MAMLCVLCVLNCSVLVLINFDFGRKIEVRITQINNFQFTLR